MMIAVCCIVVYVVVALIVFFWPAYTGEYIFDDDVQDAIAALFWPIVLPLLFLYRFRESLVKKKRKFEQQKRDILR